MDIIERARGVRYLLLLPCDRTDDHESTASVFGARSDACNAPAQSLEQEINSEVAEAGNGKASLTEVNKELSNPIPTIWALSFYKTRFG